MSAPAAPPKAWVCCHFGAREHYAIPRALHRAGALRTLVTDAWVRPGSPIGRLSARLSERFHPELAGVDVRALTARLVAREAGWRLSPRPEWETTMRRNEWFQRQSVRLLSSLRGEQVVFAHSYSARLIFRLAKARGWPTVLGQIDPGIAHFAIARRLAAEAPQFGPPPPEPPPRYFEEWRDECATADCIVVNSEWSRQSLAQAGIDTGKVKVVPLAYEPAVPSDSPRRSYPSSFTAGRPLRLLFAGTQSVVKGVPVLLEAMAALRGEPVTLRLVGEHGMLIPPALVPRESVEVVGPVSRSEVMRHYGECDVLIFPSHSDGFGMVQVEAQAAGLPIVASRHCGRVAEDGRTGIVLSEVSPAVLTAAIRSLLEQPAMLARFSDAARSQRPSSVAALGAALLAAVPA